MPTPEKNYDNCKAYGGFCGGNGKNKKYKHLTRQIIQIMRESNEVEID